MAALTFQAGDLGLARLLISGLLLRLALASASTLLLAFLAAGAGFLSALLAGGPIVRSRNAIGLGIIGARRWLPGNDL